MLCSRSTWSDELRRRVGLLLAADARVRRFYAAPPPLPPPPATKRGWDEFAYFVDVAAPARAVRTDLLVLSTGLVLVDTLDAPAAEPAVAARVRDWSAADFDLALARVLPRVFRRICIVRGNNKARRAVLALDEAAGESPAARLAVRNGDRALSRRLLGLLLAPFDE